MRHTREEGQAVSGGRGARRRRLLVVAAALAATALAGCTMPGGYVPPLEREPATSRPAGSGAGGGVVEGTGEQAQLEDGPSSTQIDWGRCGNGYECADVLLPLDHDVPDGEQVRIALKRRPADGASLGSLWINPGGPGESGIALVDQADFLFHPDVLASYDVIGFDPRGVGDSTQVECLGPDDVDPTYADFDVTSPEGIAEMEAAYVELGEKCRERSGSLLDHVGTVDVVRDLEAMRVLLGEETLNYLGYSYGTLIGAVYADTYPDRVGRMVLDGAVDPALDYATLQEQQLAGFDGAFARFVERCQAYRDCPFDPDVTVAVEDVLTLVNRLDRGPIPSDYDGELSGWELSLALQYGMYAPWDWKYLVGELAAVIDGDQVLDGADGTVIDEYGVGGGDDDVDYPYWYPAIDCSDYPTTATFAEAVGNAVALADSSPLFGTGMYAEAACVAWPVTERAERGPVTAQGAPPILVVGSRYDPATPYSWAVSLAEQLSSGVLLTYDGDGHGIYGGISTCVDDAVDAYLLTGATPAPGTECR